MDNQIMVEESARRNNSLLEEQRIGQDLKGGIPQSHKWQPKTAKAAFKKLKSGSIYDQIYKFVRSSPFPLTDRQIKKGLNKDDMNNVRPRITELIDFDYLKEVEEVIDSESKVKVRAVIARDKQYEFNTVNG